MRRDHIEARIAAIEAFLRGSARDVFLEQRHLDPGTRERAYWHYGYLCALRDVIGLTAESSESAPT